MQKNSKFMKNLHIIFFLLCIFSQTLHAKTDSSLKIQKFIKDFESQEKNFHGGTIAILQHDKVIYKSSFGQATKQGQSIHFNTLFPVASVSKSVISTALGLYSEKQAVNFDKKIKLPYLKNKVSLKDILSHSTGYKVTGNKQIESGMSRPEILQFLSKQQPVSVPGETYFYSNLLYSVVDETLSDSHTNIHLLIDNLKKQLNTNEIELFPMSSLTNVAHPCVLNKTKNNFMYLPLPQFYPKTVPAAAGVYASLNGMIEFYKLAFGYRSDLISQKTRNKLFQPVIAARDIEKWNDTKWPMDRKNIDSYYGLGWRILTPRTKPEKKLLFGAGALNGISSFVGVIPSEDVGIILLFDQRVLPAYSVGIEFWGLFLR